MDSKVIPLIAALIQAHAALRKTDKVVFRFFKLKAVNIKLLVDIAGIKEECVGGNGKQGLGQFSDAFNVECVPPPRRCQACTG